MDASRTESDLIAPRLGLWDAVSMIVGIIIGVGIFTTPAHVFAGAPGPWVGLLVWAVGGFLALVGALCFAELASTYPRSGGEYVYLTRAFGPLVGYLFAWAQLTVIRPGGIAAVAYFFAVYLAELIPLSEAGIFLCAAAAIVGLTGINLLGVTLGTAAQNLLTVAKLLGLGVLVVVGLSCAPAEVADFVPPNAGSTADWLAPALVMVLWTYAGWHEAAYVASEVKHPTRNLPLALVLGTAAVTGIYLVVNTAYLFGLGFSGAQSQTLAADLLALAWPGYGGRVMALLVVISALGAVNGMIFTTARIYSEFGADHRLFQPLSRWSRRWGTPARALVVQGVICLGLIAIVATWGQGAGSFEVMVYLTAAVFWCFFLLTGVALFVLRRTDADRPRPFRVPLYPVLPIVYCAACVYLVIMSVDYKPLESFLGLGMLLIGLPFYYFPQKPARRPVERELEPVQR